MFRTGPDVRTRVRTRATANVQCPSAKLTLQPQNAGNPFHEDPTAVVTHEFERDCRGFLSMKPEGLLHKQRFGPYGGILSRPHPGRGTAHCSLRRPFEWGDPGLRAWACLGLNLGKLARPHLLAAARLPFCQEMTGFDSESRGLVQAGLPFPSRFSSCIRLLRR